MRKFLLLSSAITLIALVSCSKKNADSNSTTWTFNGKTYIATSAGYDSSGLLGILDALDPGGNGISVVFNSHPIINGTYIVTRGDLGPSYPASNCSVSVIGNNSPNYISTGKQGDVVNVTISNGKLHATFSNITIENGDTTTVSGTIIQVTYE